jgi:signal transduction histidine kinase
LPKTLYGDESRVRQILTNLLTNAVKYTDKGSITLTVKAESAQKAGFCVLVVEVKDTGVGIKREDMEKLFGEFMQFDTKRNRGI